MPNTTAPIQVPITVGAVTSFGHVSLEIAGLSLTGGFKAVKYGRKRNREMVYSNHPDPVGKTLGQNEYNCSVEVYVAWWLAILQTVQDLLGPGYGDAFFEILTSYNANGFTPIQDVIKGCTFDTTDADNSQGTTALTRMIEFNPTKILFNSIDDCASPLAPIPT